MSAPTETAAPAPEVKPEETVAPATEPTPVESKPEEAAPAPVRALSRFSPSSNSLFSGGTQGRSCG